VEIKRYSEAKSYEAPNHRKYHSLRLFGADAGGSSQFVVGLSHFLPGGGAGPDSSPTEGEGVRGVIRRLTVEVGSNEIFLKQQDSYFIGPNENREIINRGNDVVTMLVVMSTPQT
jgi:quercetin dioxygenase-like cupin family protein